MCKFYVHRFKNFYGLRDFIHFINYIRRKKKGQGHLEKQLVLQSLERNFNGTEYFDYICELFLEKVNYISVLVDINSNFNP